MRNGFIPALRAKVFERFHKLKIKTCPFSNLPQRNKGRWGQGLTADKMAECRWLKRQLVAQIEYADWTDVNHLCHSKFIAIRDDTPAKDVRARAVSRLKPRPLPYLQEKRAGKKRLGALGT